MTIDNLTLKTPTASAHQIEGNASTGRERGFIDGQAMSRACIVFCAAAGSASAGEACGSRMRADRLGSALTGLIGWLTVCVPLAR